MRASVAVRPPASKRFQPPIGECNQAYRYFDGFQIELGSTADQIEIAQVVAIGLEAHKVLASQHPGAAQRAGDAAEHGPGW